MNATLVEFATTATDSWLRQAIVGQAAMVRLHRVIVESSADADTLVRRLTQRKYDAKQPYGGASTQGLTYAIERLERLGDPVVATLKTIGQKAVAA